MLRAALGVFVLAAVLCHGATAQVASSEHPLEGESYSAADEAYKAFNRGDYQAAATRAAQSVALRPDMLRLHLLLIDSLIAAGDLAQADKAATQASQIFASNVEIESRQANIRQRLALQPAGEGYKALERGKSVV